ncbi:hypothetical protein JHK82_019037 [Glycine max]|nr:hypothetical protein JHK82_019037 [Glycine max]
MHADGLDWFLMIFGLFGAIGDGIGTPLVLFTTSKIMNNIGGFSNNIGSTFIHNINENAVVLLYLVGGSFVTCFPRGLLSLLYGHSCPIMIADWSCTMELKVGLYLQPDSVILNDFCLKIPAGKTMALVGGSGSGKSTAISLLQRFYDPIEAEIFLDGVAIQEEVVEVAKASNAHNFISQLPQGYDTQVSATSLVICQTNPIC